MTWVPLATLVLAVSAVFAVLVSPSRPGAQPPECITIADFSANKVGEFPGDWRARKDEGKGVYAVRDEGGRRFLAAASRGLGIQAAKEREWDLNAYPVLAWSWRPREFPRGGDEREERHRRQHLEEGEAAGPAPAQAHMGATWPDGHTVICRVSSVWSS